MSTTHPSRPPPTNPTSNPSNGDTSYFDQQRSLLVSEIAISLEHVLQNINKLNRALEGVVAVGNEFGSVEALWSRFEGVMGKEGEERDGDGDANEDGDGEEEGGKEGEEEGEEEEGGEGGDAERRREGIDER